MNRGFSRVVGLFSFSLVRAPFIRASLMLLAVVGTTLLFTGCGPRRVRADYKAYENSFAVTSNHEELLNLARLEQHDPTYFFKLGQISSSYRMEASLTGTGQVSTLANPPASVIPTGGGTPLGLYENDPSFTLIPVTDDVNANILLKPVDSTVFYSLYLQGWRLDELFRLTVNRIELTLPTQNGCQVEIIRNLPPPWFDGNTNYQNDQFSLASYTEFLRVSAIIYALQKHGLLRLRETSTFEPADPASFIPNSTGGPKKPETIDTSALDAVIAEAKAKHAPVNVAITVAEAPASGGGGDAAAKNASAPAAKDFNDSAAKGQVWVLQGADSKGSGGNWVLGSKSIQPQFELTVHDQIDACQLSNLCPLVKKCEGGLQDPSCLGINACKPASEPSPLCGQVTVCEQAQANKLQNACAKEQQEQRCQQVNAYKQAQTGEQLQACQKAQAGQQLQACDQINTCELGGNQDPSCQQVKECDAEYASKAANACEPGKADGQNPSCQQGNTSKQAKTDGSYVKEPIMYGQNVADIEEVLKTDFENPSNGMKELMIGDQLGPDVREILEILYNGFSIEESSTDQESEKALCAHTPGEKPDRISAHLVMRSLIGLMGAAAQEQRSFDQLIHINPAIPNELGTVVYGTYESIHVATTGQEPDDAETAQKVQLIKLAQGAPIKKAIPLIEQLPVLKLMWTETELANAQNSSEAELSRAGLAVQYGNPLPEESVNEKEHYLITDPKPGGLPGEPFVSENLYWNRDMFRLINELSAQVSVDISKFPLPEVLQLRTE